jgi:hypothetical protein
MKDERMDNEKLNYGTKSEWYARLEAMSDEELRKHCKKYIWLSAYAHNNPRSDYHFLCDTGYNECQKRRKPEIYSEACDKLAGE